MKENPLFSPNGSLRREPTPEEIHIANRKQELISALRTGGEQVDKDAVMAELEGLWESDGTPQDVRDHIKSSLPSGAILKDILVFDPLHEREPPAGHRKAVVAVSSEDEDLSLVAINAPFPLPEGFVPVLSMRGVDVVSPVSFLEDSEWR